MADEDDDRREPFGLREHHPLREHRDRREHREPVMLSPGEGGLFQVPAGPYVIKLAGEQTAGSLAVVESTFPPGTGAPPHLHRGHDETFYVVSGAFRFQCDDLTVEEGPGAFFHVPRTRPHSFTAIGDTPGTILVTLTPAGFEKFFIEAMALSANGRPDQEMMESILAKYDQELVLPPPGSRQP